MGKWENENTKLFFVLLAFVMINALDIGVLQDPPIKSPPHTRVQKHPLGWLGIMDLGNLRRYAYKESSKRPRGMVG